MSSSATVAPKQSRGVKHPVDEVLPVPKLAVYGFQHVLAFYAGAVIVPILLASAIGLSTEQLIHLINADLFTCGIASIIQAAGFWKIGVRLPLLQGVTFTAVSPMIAIGLAAGGGTEGLVHIYGAVIVAGLFTLFLAPYFSRLIRFFPPVVTGSVITIIGIALLPVAALDVVGGGSNPQPTNGKNLAYAIGTLVLIVLMQRFFRGFLATVAVLVGLVVGTLVAWALGDATFSAVAGSPWVGVTTPFYFGWPKFAVAAVISMIVVMVITAVETTGDVFATGEIVDKRITREDIARALRADGLATTIGGVLNSFPYTCFAENVGLVRLTRIKSRWVVVAAGAFMIVLGVLPKVAAVVAGIPPPVLGGAALAMFATVAVVGIQTLSRVDFHDHRNVVIVATSVGLALLVTAQPDVAKAVPPWAQIILGSGITLGSITAIVLNFVFHHIGSSRGPAVAGAPGALVRLSEV
ncbi:MAG: uric acid transporter, partial [Pseudonocardiales bacterium]|nr:uric acid transporter [Pseudonocardiales bacterium]